MNYEEDPAAEKSIFESESIINEIISDVRKMEQKLGFVTTGSTPKSERAESVISKSALIQQLNSLKERVKDLLNQISL